MKCSNLPQILQDPVLKWTLLVQLSFLFRFGHSSSKGQSDLSFAVLTTADIGISEGIYIIQLQKCN